MRVLAVLVLTACGFKHGVALDDGGTTGDVADAPPTIDAPPDAFDDKCFGKAPFTICLQAVPTGMVSLPQDINTSSSGASHCEAIGGSVVMVSGVETCVIAGADVNVAGSVIGVTGDRPLVVVATGTITVTTTNFDVTSGRSGDGPNANPTDCMTTDAQNGTNDSAGGGGGAGGSFGGKGGDGGDGANSTAAGGTAPSADATFNTLRGGCPGGSGRGPSGDAPGGSGGGALYLVSRMAINITGKINASGAGATGGVSSRGGGGGGGSGGMIVLFAPALSLGATARVFANGGGGGGGAGNGGDGGDGFDALAPDSGALGGIGADTSASPGGIGGYKAVAALPAPNAQQGAGGGGGGVGVIRILSGQSVAPINVSPTPILN